MEYYGVLLRTPYYYIYTAKKPPPYCFHGSDEHANCPEVGMVSYSIVSRNIHYLLGQTTHIATCICMEYFVRSTLHVYI